MRSVAKAVLVAALLAVGAGQAQAGGATAAAATIGGQAVTASMVLPWVPVVGAVVVVADALVRSHRNHAEAEQAAQAAAHADTLARAEAWAETPALTMQVTKTYMDGRVEVEPLVRIPLE